MRLDWGPGNRWIKSRVLTWSIFLLLLEPLDGEGSKGPGLEALESWLSHTLPPWGGTLLALLGPHLVESARVPPLIPKSAPFLVDNVPSHSISVTLRK